MASPVVLVLGAGSRVGAGIARNFAAAGYSVGVVSRSNPSPPSVDPETSYLRIRADVSVPSEVADAFAATKKQFGNPPKVVVYNAATVSQPPDAENLLSLGIEQFEADVRVNATAAWVAAGEAAKGWNEAGEKNGRFIFTGNGLNTKPVPVPLFLTLGAGKSLAWYWVGAADGFYQSKGWRFFYADERKADGSNAGGDLGAESHGKFYLHLAEGYVEELPSAVTFVDGEYKKF
ncbi:short-chain dehydrogenase [Colletotrichum truncatum]|uniref:Short-chain dehydrogenase n=1 Tax=Colletotrichum truncatum TaxID=5467 RepID=A0ACC3ZE30_COLTU|nr:short-chain dehydrogenase [Colletotrichum truncatum]KAF6801279.1 short-chain dehydrogenase [Colletotrichum truncatum]